MKLGIITLAQAYQFAATAYDRAGKPGLAGALRFRALGGLPSDVDSLDDIAVDAIEAAARHEEDALAIDVSPTERFASLVLADVERGIAQAARAEMTSDVAVAA